MVRKGQLLRVEGEVREADEEVGGLRMLRQLRLQHRIH